MPTNKKDNNMAINRQTDFDFDKDGKISLNEIELSIKLEKAEEQMKIARIALLSMVVVVLVLISPWGPSLVVINALQEILVMYMIASASIIAAYMGFTSWLSRKP